MDLTRIKAVFVICSNIFRSIHQISILCNHLTHSITHTRNTNRIHPPLLPCLLWQIMVRLVEMRCGDVVWAMEEEEEEEGKVVVVSAVDAWEKVLRTGHHITATPEIVIIGVNVNQGEMGGIMGKVEGLMVTG